MATLKGTDPTDDRVFIISGHLDSRVSDVMNTTADAPGANDDGSGVAAMMELAKIMQTIVSLHYRFVAVTGRTRIVRSRHFSRNGQSEKWNIVAMLNNDMIGNSLSSGTRLSNNTKVRVLVKQFRI
jgi:Zn-dependent M28 family amino/carboxypeptidase